MSLRAQRSNLYMLFVNALFVICPKEIAKLRSQ